MIDSVRLAEVIAATSAPLAEGVENLRQAANTAYWDIEALGSNLMAAMQGRTVTN